MGLVRRYLWPASVALAALTGWYATRLSYTAELADLKAAQARSAADTAKAALERLEQEQAARHQDGVVYADALKTISERLAGGEHQLLVCQRARRASVPTANTPGGGPAHPAELPGTDSFTVDQSALEAVGARCDRQVEGLSKPWK